MVEHQYIRKVVIFLNAQYMPCCSWIDLQGCIHGIFAKMRHCACKKENGVRKTSYVDVITKDFNRPKYSKYKNIMIDSTQNLTHYNETNPYKTAVLTLFITDAVITTCSVRCGVACI